MACPLCWLFKPCTCMLYSPYPEWHLYIRIVFKQLQCCFVCACILLLLLFLCNTELIYDWCTIKKIIVLLQKSMYIGSFQPLNFQTVIIFYCNYFNRWGWYSQSEKSLRFLMFLDKNLFGLKGVTTMFWWERGTIIKKLLSWNKR